MTFWACVALSSGKVLLDRCLKMMKKMIENQTKMPDALKWSFGERLSAGWVIHQTFCDTILTNITDTQTQIILKQFSISFHT
jgi:hypothetical protein